VGSNQEEDRGGSGDVVFIEDEIIQDIGKLERPKAATP
jgi:hypothetical protein